MSEQKPYYVVIQDPSGARTWTSWSSKKAFDESRKEEMRDPDFEGKRVGEVMKTIAEGVSEEKAQRLSGRFVQFKY